MDSHELNRGETKRVAHLQKSYMMCSTHLQALESKFSKENLLGIKVCLSNVLTRIEYIHDEIKMNEQADMNALHLIAQEEISSESQKTVLKKRQNRSKRRSHTNRVVLEVPDTENNGETMNQGTETILQHEHDNLKMLYEILQIQHNTLEQRYMELEQQYQENVIETNAMNTNHEAHLQETLTLNLELKNIKQQYKTSQKQNKRLNEKMIIQTQNENEVIDDTSTKLGMQDIKEDTIAHTVFSEDLKTRKACIFCGYTANFCRVGIHTCKKCIDILYL
jgi:regulator of replication initiation timing